MPLVFFLLSFSLSVIVPQARFFRSQQFDSVKPQALFYYICFFLFCFISFSVFASPVAANGPQCPLIRCARYPLCTHFFRFHSVYAYGKYFHVSAKFCALTKELHIHHHKAYFLYVYKTVEAAASPKMEHTKLCDMCLIMNAYENSRSFIHKHTHIQFGDVTQNSDGNSNSHQKRYIMSKNFLYPPNDERKIKSSMKLQKV